MASQLVGIASLILRAIKWLPRVFRLESVEQWSLVGYKRLIPKRPMELLVAKSASAGDQTAVNGLKTFIYETAGGSMYINWWKHLLVLCVSVRYLLCGKVSFTENIFCLAVCFALFNTVRADNVILRVKMPTLGLRRKELSKSIIHSSLAETLRLSIVYPRHYHSNCVYTMTKPTEISSFERNILRAFC